MKEGRIRFNTVLVSDHIIRDARVEELKKWCGVFQRRDLTPVFEGNYTGNLSFRVKDGFVITASGLKSKENLTDESFVYVKTYNEKSNTFYIEGKKKPSSESIMHQLIYGSNKEVNAVFHGHNDLIVAYAKKMGFAVTEKEYESGTLELAKEVLKVLADNKLVVLRNHGFVCMGKTMEQLVEEMLAS